MNNTVSVEKRRIPFIPRLSREYKPMKYYFCETEATTKQFTRSAFMHLLAQQSCPWGQLIIDFDDGFVYLVPYDSERAAKLTIANRKFETEYKHFYREQEAIRAGNQLTMLHLEQFKTDEESDGNNMQSAWLVSEETPEDDYLAREHFIIHQEAFDTLSASDRAILTGFLEADCNARELARRLGKDPSGVLKLVKRATERLKKEIEKNWVFCTLGEKKIGIGQVYREKPV